MEPQDFEFPDDCLVDFDMRLIGPVPGDGKEEGEAGGPGPEEYFRVKELLDGKVPTRMDPVHLHGGRGIPAVRRHEDQSL